MSFSFDNSNTPTHIQKFKIVMLGDSSVGKTSIINRFLFDIFQEETQSTIGIDFVSKSFNSDEKIIKFQLWDTAGQERFRSLIPCYIRDCSIAIIVFDLLNKQSLYNVESWVNDVKEIRGDKAKIYLVGNKLDIKINNSKNSQLENEIIQNFGQNYIEVSAKNGDNIKQLFQSIAKQLKINDQIDFSLYEKTPKNISQIGHQNIDKKCC